MLNSYCGTYASDTGWEYQIDTLGGSLRIGSPYQAPVRLLATDERTFRLFEATYTFVVEEGRAVAFCAERPASRCSSGGRRGASDGDSRRAG